MNAAKLNLKDLKYLSIIAVFPPDHSVREDNIDKPVMLAHLDFPGLKYCKSQTFHLGRCNGQKTALVKHGPPVSMVSHSAFYCPEFPPSLYESERESYNDRCQYCLRSKKPDGNKV